jgi:murein DD-endopeptidase MepM/ murein hydrolase activator NlpD
MDQQPLPKEFLSFIHDLFFYITHRLHKTGLNFEKVKDFVVDILMVRRGANTSLFVHFSILGLAAVVLIGGGVISPTSVVSGSYPGVAVNPLVASSTGEATAQGVISSTITPVTIVSDKPRDKIADYEVKSGDTIASIARDWGVSQETVMWANDLSSTSRLTIDQKLKILPVSGVSHKVVAGDTIYSVAKKYQANAQAIIDFPFNDVGDDFQLHTGDTLIVPDGAPPAQAKPAPTQYLASGQQNISVEDLGSAQFVWPASGGITQFFSWYHPGIDIANLGGGPIHAADSGTIIHASWDSSGYGNMILIDHGNGYVTRYGHMSAFYVSVGQKVGKGDTVGAMGSTGRSSGTHLHFEIIKDGARLNPYSFLGH